MYWCGDVTSLMQLSSTARNGPQSLPLTLIIPSVIPTHNTTKLRCVATMKPAVMDNTEATSNVLFLPNLSANDVHVMETMASPSKEKKKKRPTLSGVNPISVR